MIIKTVKLNKNFLIPQKEAGLLPAFKSLWKPSYQTKIAIQDFDLEIQRGEFVGLLGPNGAGKTTLIKMLTGIIAPSSGVAEVLGHTPFTRPLDFRKNIALVMGQKSQLWWDIPAIDSFNLLATYYELDPKFYQKRLAELTAKLNLSSILNTPIRKLSLGERMKMELSACLLHNPQVIFLDEPTIGLDVVAQENIRNFLKNYQTESNCTIILTSHYMADITALCRRIVLVLDGRKDFDGELADFQNILGNKKLVTLRFGSAPNQADSIWEKFLPEWEADGLSVELQVPIEQLNNEMIKILNAFPIQDFQTEKLPIEKVMKILLNKQNALNATK